MQQAHKIIVPAGVVIWDAKARELEMRHPIDVALNTKATQKLKFLST
jgi:hypothetical protein